MGPILVSIMSLMTFRFSDQFLLEGPWSEVSKTIHDCHAAVHAKGAPRIATNIRIGTRVDREAPVGRGNEDKVKRVEEILARDRA